MNMYNNLKKGEKGAYLSIIAYFSLSCLKLSIGFITDSAALKADGFNNTTDIIASIAVLIGLRLAQRPIDKRHQYGHWKNETIAAMIASFIMMTVGIQVLFSTVLSFTVDAETPPNLLASYVGVFSFIVMYLVYRYNKKLAGKIKSQAVMAAAKGNITDAWISIGTTVGIIGSQLQMPWLDGVTAFIIGLLICKTAWDIFKEASHMLSDGFDEKQLDLFITTSLKVANVLKVKEMKGRSYGNNVVVDALIVVDAKLTLAQANEVAKLVAKRLKEQHKIYDAYIRIEPDKD